MEVQKLKNLIDLFLNLDTGLAKQEGHPAHTAPTRGVRVHEDVLLYDFVYTAINSVQQSILRRAERRNGIVYWTPKLPRHKSCSVSKFTVLKDKILIFWQSNSYI